GAPRGLRVRPHGDDRLVAGRGRSLTTSTMARPRARSTPFHSGPADVAHFNELEHGLPGISRSLLPERLRRLEEVGVLEQRTVKDGKWREYRHPLAESYALSRGGPMSAGWNQTAAVIVHTSASAINLPMLDVPG